MKLLWVGETRRESEAERWAARSFADPVPLCAARVALILSECLNCDFENLAVDSAFHECGDFTELDQVKLILALEEKFGLTIEDEDAAALKTPGAVISYVEARQRTVAAA